MVCALGLEDRLVGITHECDYPPTVRQKPVVVKSRIDTRRLTPAAIDRAVSERLKEGQSLYEVDIALLHQLGPDLILTQHLCDVCGPSKPEALQALEALPQAEICYFSPHCLDDIWDNLREVGKKTNRRAEAAALIKERQEKVAQIRRAVEGRSRPKVFFMEWVDPVFNAGHWVAELIALAGGRDELANVGRDSVRISWEKVVAYQPEIIIVSPCGYDQKAAAAQLPLLERYPGWSELPAVRQGRVHAVDANAYFARPGPRVVDGAEVLARLLHPSAFR